MDLLIAIAAALTAFLAGLYGTLAPRLLPRVDRGACAACGRDIRDAAWRGSVDGTSPRCECGADLGRVGAVRAVGHEPVGRLRRLGLVAGGLCATIVIVDIGLRATGRSWLSLLPARMVGWTLAHGSESIGLASVLELNRRFERGGLSPDDATQLLHVTNAVGKSSTRVGFATWDLGSRLLVQSLSEPGRAADAAKSFSLSVKRVDTAPAGFGMGSGLSTGSGGGWRLSALRASSSAWPALGPLVRIRSIEANGIEVPWRILSTVRAAPAISTRTFVIEAEVEVGGGASLPPGTTITVHADIILLPAWPYGAPFSEAEPLVDGPVLSEDLGLGEHVAPCSLTITLPSVLSSEVPSALPSESDISAGAGNRAGPR